MFKSKFLMLTSVWYVLHNCLMMWMRKKLAHDLANQAEITLQPSTQTIWPLYPWTIHLLYFYNLEIKYLLATHSHQSQDEAAPAFGSNTEGSRLLEATVWFQRSVDHQRSSLWCPHPPSPAMGSGKHHGQFVYWWLTQKPHGPQGNLLALKDRAKVSLVKRCSKLFGPRAKAGGINHANV